MFITMPRKGMEEVLIQMLERKMDVTDITDRNIKYYLDLDVLETLKAYRKWDTFELSTDLDNAVVIEGQMNEEEIEELKRLEERNCLKIASVIHLFEFINNGGYGPMEDPFERLNDKDYWVKAYIHKDGNMPYLQSNLYAYLPTAKK